MYLIIKNKCNSHKNHISHKKSINRSWYLVDNLRYQTTFLNNYLTPGSTGTEKPILIPDGYLKFKVPKGSFQYSVQVSWYLVCLSTTDQFPQNQTSTTELACISKVLLTLITKRSNTCRKMCKIQQNKENNKAKEDLVHISIYK